MGGRPEISIGNSRRTGAVGRAQLRRDRAVRPAVHNDDAGGRIGGAALRRTRAWVSWLGMLLLAGCAVAPRPAPPAAIAWHRTTLGLCEDYPEETRTLQHARQDLATAHAAGARVLRIAFGWDSMEPSPGHYDWRFWDEYVRMAVEDYGLQLIPYICYTPKWAASDQGDNYWRSPPRNPADFGRFVDAIVRHYRGRIHSWELWNEPDNPAYWLGTPHQFAALVRAGSAAVRRADPGARVVLGGIAGELDFLSKLLVDEHLGPAVDVINIHSYYETWHPSPIEQLPQYVNAAASLIHDTGGHQPLWMAETGYSSVGPRAEVSSVYRAHFNDEHTEAAQAAALDRTVLTALATEQVALLAWYRINDLVGSQEVIGDDNNRHLGLRRANGAPKPALAAFTFLTRLFRERYEVLTPRVTTTGATAAVEVRAFLLHDGRRIVAAWLAMPAQPAAGAPQPDARAASVRILLPKTRVRRVYLHDAEGRSDDAGESWRAHGGGTELRLKLRGGEVRVAELMP